MTTRSSPSGRTATSSNSSPAHWLQRAGAVLASEARESKGQSWLTNRASSTDLLANSDDDDGDDDDDDDDHGNAIDDYRLRQHRSAEGIALVNDEFSPIRSRLFSGVASRPSLDRHSRTDPNPIGDHFSPRPDLVNNININIDDNNNNDDDDENENGKWKQGQIILAQKEQLRRVSSRQRQRQLDRDRLEDAEIDRLTRPYHVDAGVGAGAGTGIDAGLGGIAAAAIVGDLGFFFTFGKWLVDGMLGLSASSTMDDLDRSLDRDNAVAATAAADDDNDDDDDDDDNEGDIKEMSKIVGNEVKNKQGDDDDSSSSTVDIVMASFLSVATQTLLS